MLRRALEAFWGHKSSQLYKRAKEVARDRLRVRPELSASEIVASCPIPVGEARSAERMLVALGKVVQVKPGQFRADDRLGDLLTVDISSLTQGLPVNTDGDPTQKIEVLGYDIFAMLEEVCDRSRWRAQMTSNGLNSRNEDAWIDHIMQMTLSDFLLFFGPLVRAD